MKRNVPKRARSLVALGLAATALVAAGCGSDDGGSGASANTTGPVSLKVGLFGALSDAGVYIAQDRGYFKQEGLNVKIVPTGTAEQIISLLAAGKVDAAGTSPTPGLFAAISQGVKVRIAADKGQIGPKASWVAVVVRKDLAGSIRTPADLKGKKVALPGKGTATAAELTQLLKQSGLKLSDVNVQPGNPADALVALTNKAVDAAVLQEPFITLAQVQGVGTILTPLGDVVPNGENGIIAVSEKLAKDKGITDRLLKAYRRGVADYRAAFPTDGSAPAGQAGVVQILIKNTPVKKAPLYQKMAPVQFSADGSVDTKSIDLFQQIFKEQGLQTQIVPSTDYLLDAQGGQ